MYSVLSLPYASSHQFIRTLIEGEDSLTQHQSEHRQRLVVVMRSADRHRFADCLE